MTNQPKFAFTAHRMKPHADDFHTAAEWEGAIAALNGNVPTKDPATGEDVSDLVPKPEASSKTWDRFNGKLKSGKAA